MTGVVLYKKTKMFQHLKGLLVKNLHFWEKCV